LPKIRLVNINKKYEGLHLLKNVNLEIPNNTLFVILGPPRSGKTALGRILAGLELPDSGSIFFGDEDVTYKGPNQRNVSLVFQDFALYPHLTAYDNIASSLLKSRLTKEEIRKRVKEFAEYLKIDHRLTHYPSELSGGEKQRVAIARALVRGAQIIILDEPFVRLDYKVREDMRAQLYRLHRDLGVTVIILSSDHMDAMAFPDNIAFMLEGEIIQVGNLDAMYEQPTNLSIAKYLGLVEMNVFPAKSILDLKGTEIPRSLSMLDGTMLIGFRPEHVTLHYENTLKPDKIILAGKVKITEIVGSETIVHLDAGLLEPVRVLISMIVRKTPGEAVRVAVDVKDIYVFDAKGKFVGRGGDLIGGDIAR
jgi:multiple sugar transport system ATP-binding protein